VWKSEPIPSDEELSPVEIKGIFSELIHQVPIRRIDLTGGEPLLRRDIFDIIDLLSALGLRISMVTDAKHIDSETAKDLAKREIALVQPTLLSTDRQVHNTLKGSDAFDDTLRAIAYLIKENIRVSVSFICTKMNYRDFDEVVKLCYALGVRHLGFSRLCTAGEAIRHLDDICPEPWMVWECLEKIPALSARYRLGINNLIALPHCVAGSPIRADLAARAGSCSIATGTPNFTISPSGDVRPCSISTMVIGNLVEDGWPSITRRYREEILPLYRGALSETCRDCELVSDCLGGCRASALGARGSLIGGDPLCLG